MCAGIWRCKWIHVSSTQSIDCRLQYERFVRTIVYTFGGFVRTNMHTFGG